MALTTAQEMALFQALEVPWQPVVNELQDRNNLTVQIFSYGSSIRSSNIQIRAYLTAYIYADPAAETVLVQYLDRWITLGTDVVRLSGGVGPVQGVECDPEAERREIQRQIKILVPFWRHHTEVERGSGSGSMVPICR
jgi:hypothetical protein